MIVIQQQMHADKKATDVRRVEILYRRDRSSVRSDDPGKRYVVPAGGQLLMDLESLSI